MLSRVLCSFTSQRLVSCLRQSKEKNKGRRWERKDAIEPYCSTVAAAGVGVQMVWISTSQPSLALRKPLIIRIQAFMTLALEDISNRGFMSSQANTYLPSIHIGHVRPDRCGNGFKLCGDAYNVM